MADWNHEGRVAITSFLPSVLAWTLPEMRLCLCEACICSHGWRFSDSLYTEVEHHGGNVVRNPDLCIVIQAEGQLCSAPVLHLYCILTSIRQLLLQDACVMPQGVKRRSLHFLFPFAPPFPALAPTLACPACAAAPPGLMKFCSQQRN